MGCEQPLNPRIAVMHMSLAPVQRLSLRMELQIDSAVTLTVFPMSERWLRAFSDRQWVAKQVAGRCKAENFRSVMDFLFANVFPDCYWLVMSFYADEAPPLREILTREQCIMIDSVLVEALKLAYEDHCADRERSWSRIRRTSDQRYFRSVG
jgi:hypothetical protein